MSSDDPFPNLGDAIRALRHAVFVPPITSLPPRGRSVVPSLGPPPTAAAAITTPSALPRAIIGTREAISEQQKRIRHYRSEIMSISKKNFKTEHQLTEMEKQIKVLIKNKIVVEDSQESTPRNGEGKEDANFGSKREQYELLFRHLQSNPSYLAAMARYVNDGKSAAAFVQTVVFDMYGDQYGDRDERLLLLCFRHALKAEILDTPNLGSLFRANTAVTQMLSAYARRGQGLSVLRSVLEEPLKELTSKADLNLEISPQAVYTQVIAEQELEGKAWVGPRNVTDEQAMENPLVAKIVKEHSQQLLDISDNILKRIIECVDSIPMGMRWICKQLGQLCRQRFPDADKYQIGSIMGGYINLRFFNPVIVTPDALNFISTKPSRSMRRNLVLIAKVLQNLSNGLEFGDKEQFMSVVNTFIRSRKEVIQAYFEKLAQVEDLEDVWEIDKLQEHESNKPINLMLSQVHLCHKTLYTNLDALCPKGPEHDELRKIVESLGVPKPFPEDMMVSLQVVPTKSKVEKQQQIFATHDTSAFSETKQNVMILESKELVATVLLMLPEQPFESITGWGLVEFLEQEQNMQGQELTDKISEVIKSLRALRGIGALSSTSEARPVLKEPLSPSSKATRLPPPSRAAPLVIPPEAVREFITKLVVEFRELNDQLRHLTKRLDLIQAAHSSLERHHEYLTGRADVLRIYLDNVKRGGTTEQVRKSVKVEKPAKVKVVKMSADQLVKEGLISKIEPEIDKKLYKSINFKFSQLSTLVFQVEVSFKVGMEMNVLDRPIQLYLEDLLRMSEERENSLYFDPVTLNTNILIHFLNHHFGADRKSVV